MLTLHHLNNSRSHRILWLLEELGVEYQIKTYQRDSKTNLAPSTLKLIHPLGKAPVITDGDVTMAESGAIIEYLISQYADDSWKPAPGSEAQRQYLYWLHFAEGSMMPPLVAKLVLGTAKGKAKPFFVKAIASKFVDAIMSHYYGPIIDSALSFVDEYLANHEWFAGEQISGADIQMSFPLEAALARVETASCRHIRAWLDKVHQRPAYQQALYKGGQYDYA